MSAGIGFSDWTSRGFLNVNCTSHGNGTAGFNIEVSQGVRYIGCISHDNRASGFTVNGSTGAEIVLCSSKDNGNNGVDFVVGSFGHVIDSAISGNVNDPVFYDDSSQPNCSVLSDGTSYPAAWLTAANAAVYGTAGAPTDAGLRYLGTRLAIAIRPPNTGLLGAGDAAPVPRRGAVMLLWPPDPVPGTTGQLSRIMDGIAALITAAAPAGNVFAWPGRQRSRRRPSSWGSRRAGTTTRRWVRATRRRSRSRCGS